MAYKHTSLKAYAVIGGIGKVDIARLSVNYVVGDIPTAVISVAVGTQVTGISTPATTIVSQLKKRSTIEIYAAATGDLVPGGVSKLFSGYTTSVSLVSEPGMRAVQVTAVNWLDDLRSTSAFSEYRTAQACYNVTTPASMFSGTGIGQKARTLEGVKSELGQSGSDFYALMTKLTTDIANGKFTGSAQYKNNTALKALAKITGDLPFQYAGTASVKAGVVSMLTARMLTLYGTGGNIYDAWRQLSGDFLFMIIPHIDTAMVIPWDPMTTEIDKTLDADDYVYISQVQITRRSIAGMLLTADLSMGSNGDYVIKTAPSMYYAGEPEGILDAVTCPAWLMDPILNTRAKRTYSTINGFRTRSIDIKAEGENQASLDELWNSNVPVIQSLGEAYAKLVLGHKQFGPNVLTLKGPLRTDVWPGMVIGVRLPRDTRFSSGQILYGFVNNISIDINSESASASTTINLSHVRNASDNVKYGNSGNPLYTATAPAGNLMMAEKKTTSTTSQLKGGPFANTPITSFGGSKFSSTSKTLGGGQFSSTSKTLGGGQFSSTSKTLGGGQFSSTSKTLGGRPAGVKQMVETATKGKFQNDFLGGRLTPYGGWGLYGK